MLHVLGPTIALSANPAGGHIAAYGTLWEPNVLGAVSGAGAIGWFLLGRRHFAHPWIGLACCLGGVLVSFTRTAWIATAVVLAVAALVAERDRMHVRTLVLGCLGGLVVATAVGVVDRVGDYYQPPAGAVGSVQTQHRPASGLLGVITNATDVIGRIQQAEIVFGDVKPRALLGGGTGSYGERHMVDGQPQHIANLELTVLNDTGLVGSAVFGVFLVAIAYAAWKNRGDPNVDGLGMVILMLAIANQLTETMELMVTWFLVGLLMAAIERARLERRVSRPHRHPTAKAA
jgi:O-antigen ligase